MKATVGKVFLVALYWLNNNGAHGSADIVQSGLLTAGDVDDNLNFQSFLSFSNRSNLVQHYEEIGLQNQRSSGMVDLSKRVTVRVSDSEGKPYSGAIVEVLADPSSSDEAKKQYPVGTNGKLWLYPSLEGLGEGTLTLQARDYNSSCPGSKCSDIVEIKPKPYEYSPSYASKEIANANGAGDGTGLNLIVEGISFLPKQLDVVFVIDTTGSMCDELSYIQAELKSVIGRVASTTTNTQQEANDENNMVVDIRVAIVVYRDEQDEYVVRSTQFTDVETASAALSKENCGGGGDWPEAMDQAMKESANALEWRSGNVARVLFVVADAPPHDDKVEDTLKQTLALKSKGVRVYGLSGSGVEETLEYFMRLLSLVTGGRYMFLTDDSGIGNSHAEPSIVCYQVTRLDNLLVRVLQTELIGKRVEADPDHIIRESGKQERGVCIIDVEPLFDTSEGIFDTDIGVAVSDAEYGDVSIKSYSAAHVHGSYSNSIMFVMSAFAYILMG